MKFIYFGDFHNKEEKPLARLDDWQQTLDEKAREILALADKHNTSYLLQPGDFFDSARVSEAYLKRVIDRWFSNNIAFDKDAQDMVNLYKSGNPKKEDLIKLLKALGCKKQFIGVVGNHEQIGASGQNIERTTCGFIEKMGLMQFVSKEEPVIIQDKGFSIAITGSSYHPNIDKENPRASYIVKEKLADFHIHIVHGAATTCADNTLFVTTSAHHIAECTLADVTLVGHDHRGFDPVCVDGRWVLNPGAPVRLTAGDLSLKPKVLVLNFSKEEGFSFETEYLQSAKPDVLSNKHIVDAKKQEQMSQRYDELIAQSQVKQQSGFKGILNAIAEAEKISDELRADLLSKISAEQTVIFEQEVYFTKLELENFQSHKHSVLEFGKGLNVLTGETCAGKTAVLRAFDWILNNNKKNPKRFIHHGTDFAQATVTLNTGIKICRRVESKRAGFNGYIINYPDGKTETLNTKGVEVVQSLCGYCDLKLSENKSLPVNFMRQGSSWYFIGDNLSGFDRANAVGAIFATTGADQAQKDIELEVKSHKKTLEAKEQSEKRLQIAIEAKAYVDEVEKRIAKAELLIGQADKLSLKIEELKAFKVIVEQNKNAQSVECETLASLTQLLQMRPVINKAITIAKQYQAATDLRAKLRNTKIQIEIKNGVIHDAQSYLKVGPLIKDSIERCERINQMTKLQTTIKTLSSKGHRLKQLIGSANDMLMQRENIARAMTTNELLNEYKSTSLTVHSLLTQGTLLNKEYKQYQKLNSVKDKVSSAIAKSQELKTKRELRATMSLIHQNGQLERDAVEALIKQQHQYSIEKSEILDGYEVCPLCQHTIEKGGGQ